MNPNWQTEGHVYILRLPDGNYFVGSTPNLRLQLQKHRSDLAVQYGSFELVYQEDYGSLEVAEIRANQLKKWSRKKKEALISGDIELVKRLSRSRDKDQTDK